MDLIIESAGETEEECDVLQLVVENWLDLGIKAYVKPLQRQVLRNRIFAGETLMAFWFGLENGIPSADMSPQEFAPTTQQQYQWPKWGQYFETRGQVGQPPDLPEAKRLLDLYNAWRRRRPPTSAGRSGARSSRSTAIRSTRSASSPGSRSRSSPTRICATCPRTGSSTGSLAPSSASTGPIPSGSRTTVAGGNSSISSNGAPVASPAVGPSRRHARVAGCN